MHYITHSTMNGMDTSIDSMGKITVSEHFPSLLVAIVMTLLPLVAIFLFKNRGRQMGITALAIVAVIGFEALMLMYVGNLGKQATPPTTGSYWIGAILPVIAMIFMFFAIAGIRRDQKLVKSVDRLR